MDLKFIREINCDVQGKTKHVIVSPESTHVLIRLIRINAKILDVLPTLIWDSKLQSLIRRGHVASLLTKIQAA